MDWSGPLPMWAYVGGPYAGQASPLTHPFMGVTSRA